MASVTELRRRAQRALVGAKEKAGTKATELGERARKTAEEVRAQVERSRASAGPDGWQPARIAAGVAGGFLIWRALFGRGLARIPAALAGLTILQAAFPRAAERLSAAARAGGSEGRGQRRTDVFEAKSPAELERGAATGSPRPSGEHVDDGGANGPEPLPPGGVRH